MALHRRGRNDDNLADDEMKMKYSKAPAPAKAGTAAGGFGQPAGDEEIPF